MQGSRVPVSPVRPNQSMDFRVNLNLVEQRDITKWPKPFALQYGLEINNLFRAVVETNSKRVRCLYFKRNHSIYGAAHAQLMPSSAIVGLRHLATGLVRRRGILEWRLQYLRGPLPPFFPGTNNQASQVPTRCSHRQIGEGQYCISKGSPHAGSSQANNIVICGQLRVPAARQQKSRAPIITMSMEMICS